MTNAVEQLHAVRTKIANAEREARREPGAVTLVAVSKTFAAEDIRPVIEAGQRVFGENRVQEAQGKWPSLREDFPDLELHLIGPLQSNKAKEAV
ncbi:MAG: YggS family pyridoxal phosphate-dependent enzyme, partial [Mesorhizobium sp.]